MSNKFLVFPVFSFIAFLFSSEMFAGNIKLTSSGVGGIAPCSLAFSVNIPEIYGAVPAHLNVINDAGDYRKLQIGNNPTSLYSPSVNVVGLGNNTMEVTIKVKSASIDWTKIMLKPNGLGTLCVANYIKNARLLADNWMTIVIPLADFSTTIDFKAIKQIHFPYSNNAPAFELGISSIKFTGSAVPYNYFGESKVNNIQNGNGGPGELKATLVAETLPVNPVASVQTYINGQADSLLSQYPYIFSKQFLSQGIYNVHAQVLYKNQEQRISDTVKITVTTPLISNLAATILCPDTVLLIRPATFPINVEVVGAQPKEPAYIHVTNVQSGYRKLNIGYNELNLYGPMQNLTASGNSRIDITIKDNLGTCDWSRVAIKLNEKGNVAVKPYIDLAGGLSNVYKTISIPLSAFGSTVDLTQISYLTFPYSNDAGVMDLSIKSLVISGGPQPLVWFGEEKGSVSHNGLGRSGELVAELVQPVAPENELLSVDFFANDSLLSHDIFSPYQYVWENIPVGIQKLKAVANVSGGRKVSSSEKLLNVKVPVVDTVSNLQISIASSDPDTVLYPSSLGIVASIAGKYKNIPEHILSVAVKSDYSKSLIGYHPTNLYAGGNNVIAGGNTFVEVTMKVMRGNPDWTKMYFKPKEKGTLRLSPYLSSAMQLGDGWFTLKIPLADFDPTIIFSDVNYLAFPYSADAGVFEIAVESIVFKGGSTPFVWYGENKRDNAIAGKGGPGELSTTKVAAFTPEATISAVTLYDNNIILATDSVEPFQFEAYRPEPGIHHYRAVLCDSKSRKAYSSTITKTVLDESARNGILISMTFDANPNDLSVSVASLRYNKAFAYSITLDDGLADAYTNVFTLLNGGYNVELNRNYPGLSFTDGNGNDVRFTASSAVYCVNTLGIDLHVNTAGYLKWTQMTNMYNAGWDILNHSYSHAAYSSGMDYNYQITRGRDYIFEKTGIKATGFVIPSGDANYVLPALANGYNAIYSQNYAYLGNDGLDVNKIYDYSNFKMSRRNLIEASFDTTSILTKINQIASQSVGGKHFWLSDFTHNVKTVSANGGLIYSTFEYMANNIERLYGKSGSDNIWVAPVQRVYEYLKLRDAVKIDYVLYGQTLKIWLDTTGMPGNLKSNDLTLVIKSTSKAVLNNNSGIRLESFDGNKEVKLLNFSIPQGIGSKSGKMTVSPGFEIQGRSKGSVLNTIFPNPVNAGECFTLNCSAECDGFQWIALISSNGVPVQREKRLLKEGINEIKVSTEGVRSGLYIVKLGEKVVGKMMIK